MELEVQGATFAYPGSSGPALIFEDVSFGVKNSEIFCILGPNGAGKSTLLKCMANMLALKRGRITYDGTDVLAHSRRELAKIVAYLPQDHMPAFPFPVLDVVTMGRTAHIGRFASPRSKDVAIALKNMEFLRISHLAEKRYTNVSGGERQLVMLAAALTQEPAFLLLDEPTSHLDFGNRHRLLNLLRSLKNMGVGVVMTSHFPDHALAAADKVAAFKSGAIMCAGTPEEVITAANMSALYDIQVDVMDTRRGKVCVAEGV